MIYLTAIELTPGGSSTVHIYTQTIHRTTQLTTLVGRLSGIRTQSGETKINDELTARRTVRTHRRFKITLSNTDQAHKK